MTQNTIHGNHKLFSLTIISIVSIVLFVSFTQIAYGLIDARGQKPSRVVDFLSYLALSSLVGYWLFKDNRMYKVYRAYDMGFFVFLAWPFILLFYLIKTRGLKRTLLITLGFLGIGIGAYVIGGVLGTFLLLGLY